MTQVLMALVMFALTAYCVSRTWEGYRDGTMPLFFGTVRSLVFERPRTPALFWGAAAFNAAVTAVCAGGGLVLLIGAATGR